MSTVRQIFCEDIKLGFISDCCILILFLNDWLIYTFQFLYKRVLCLMLGIIRINVLYICWGETALATTFLICAYSSILRRTRRPEQNRIDGNLPESPRQQIVGSQNVLLETIYYIKAAGVAADTVLIKVLPSKERSCKLE